MSGLVVVDAGLALMWVIQEPGTPKAMKLLAAWQQQDVERIAPALFAAECGSGLLKHVRLGTITIADARRALGVLLRAVTVQADDVLAADRAMEIGAVLALFKAYDPLYAALAERVGCELWTGEERFYNAAHPRFPFVHWVGEVAL